MFHSLRSQWLIPFGGILLLAVATTSIVSAWLAGERFDDFTQDRLERVVETVTQSRFPFSPNVLRQMRDFSGADFVAFNENGDVQASTLSTVDTNPELTRGWLERYSETQPNTVTRTIAGKDYLVTVMHSLPPGTRAKSLAILFPEGRRLQERKAAVVPPLFVGAATLAVMFVVSAWLADRMSRRIRRLQMHVTDIAEGEFRQIARDSRKDEIDQLCGSINSMSRQLQRMQSTIQVTEQTRLMGQLAGGLAHQLRNAITGARLAIQIHAKRCANDSDSSLTVALRQLELTEEQVRGLLSLGKPEQREPRPLRLSNFLDEICLLLTPVIEHAKIEFHRDASKTHAGEDLLLADSDPLRTAVVNLLLNAVDAAGIGGQVSLVTEQQSEKLCFSIIDSGSGPPAELGDAIFEPLVTGKSDGVGFGLALVAQVAEDHEGDLSFDHSDGQTCFRLELPLSKIVR